jgi:hypothetical protein
VVRHARTTLKPTHPSYVPSPSCAILTILIAGTRYFLVHVPAELHIIIAIDDL